MSKDLLSAVLEALDHGAAIYRADMTLLVANRRYAELFRLPPHLTKAGAAYSAVFDHRCATLQLSPEGMPGQLILLRDIGGGALAATQTSADLGHTIELNLTVLADGSILETCRETTADKGGEGWLEQVSMYDDLTGLSNRMHFITSLRGRLAKIAEGAVGSVFFIGLDDFQDVNDLLGHALGNQVVCGVAERLSEAVDDGDLVARLTGVEFAVLKPGLDDQAAAAVYAERLIHRLQRKPIPVDRIFEVDVPVSVGISRYPADGSEPGEVMRNADLALARARMNRSSRYHFFSMEMSEQANRQAMVKLELSQALERNEFEVYYQPKVDLRPGFVTGMAALVRWIHPERGVIPPGLFIPVAERTGLISPISDFIMREACSQTRRWSELVARPLKVAVNLSTVQFRRQSIVGSVTAILEETGLDPECLEIEITEGVLLHDDEVIVETFSWLKAIGVPIAIDDFGTGYSSLSYLKKFAMDTVKIDGSFIRDLELGGENTIITRAIIGLVHALGMTVVAEGVEQAAHVRFLSEAGCDIGQGYYFGRPMPAADFEAMLLSNPNFLLAAVTETKA